MRQIVLDTETTGIDPKQGHRIIEVGALEMVNRRITGNNLHFYINPEREVEAEALAVHGITNEFLKDKPLYSDVAGEIIEFMEGAELIIHNAPFDLGFLDHEFKKCQPKYGKVIDHCDVIDSLVMARKLHPGQRNSLDALCKRYAVDNSDRQLHGALLDAKILANVYLAMTGGQVSLFDDSGSSETIDEAAAKQSKQSSRKRNLLVQKALDDELNEHQKIIDKLAEKSGLNLWDVDE